MPDINLSFHPQDKDFKPITIPDWVWNAPVQAFDMCAPNHADIKRAARQGAKVVHNFGIKPYWPLKKDDPNSPGVEEPTASQARERIDLSHSLGMRFCYGIYPWAPIPLLKKHTEWVIHPEDNDSIEQELNRELGDSIRMDEYAKLARLCVMCFNSPYADYYIECLAEILRDFKIDAISFDGNYHPHVCYCGSCKEKYKKATGKAIPPKVDFNDLEYREYFMWAEDQHEAFFARLQRRMREINPEFAVMSWSVNSGRWMQLSYPPYMPRRMNMLLDCPLTEWWLDEYHRGSTIVPAFNVAYSWAVTDHRVAGVEPYMMTHWWPYDTDSFPEHEAIRRSMLILANGCYCPIAYNYPYAESVIDEIARRSKWLSCIQPHKWGAVLVSEQTRINYGRDKIVERYLSYPLGVFRMAYEEHLPLNVITEWDLRPEELAKYAVVFLPNAACLSDDHIAVIREYVANGGGLIASNDTSLFDEIGRPRPNFGLADVFGVEFRGRPGDTADAPSYDFAKEFDNREFWNSLGGKRVNWTGAEDPLHVADKSPGGIARVDWADSPFAKDERLRKLSPNPQVNFKGGMALVTEPADKKNLLMTIVQSAWPDAAAVGEKPIPGAVFNSYGKGKVIYLAAAIDAAYYGYSYPYQRYLLRQAVDMVKSHPEPIAVDAPMCVQSTFLEQKDESGSRILVHLFNDVNTSSNHGDQEFEIPMREETIPIAGIRVTFDGYNAKEFHLEPEGIKLAAKADGTKQTVEVPKLEMHSIVVAELA